MSTTELARDIILTLGTGLVLVQVFKAAECSHFASLLRVATWTSASYPFILLVREMSNSDLMQNIVKFVAFLFS